MKRATTAYRVFVALQTTKKMGATSCAVTNARRGNTTTAWGYQPSTTQKNTFAGAAARRIIPISSKLWHKARSRMTLLFA